MRFIGNSISLFGLILVSHACYSAQEHTTLQALRSMTSASLPSDIVIETIFGTLVLTLGLILSAPKLRPISWRVWAGKIEKEGPAVFVNDPSKVTDMIGNPFQNLESRPGFVDIRRQRREFAKWVSQKESS